MEKVIRRAERAHRVSLRQKAKLADHRRKGEAWERGQTRLRNIRDENERKRQDKKNRKLDWEAGPLAPRRDVGELAKNYGTMSLYTMHMADKDPEDRPKWLHIHEGDRVAVMKGRDRGKIGTVMEMDVAKAAVRIQGINMADVAIPDWMIQERGGSVDEQTIQSVALHVPLEDVKLVYPLPDPETGIPRDVIIDRLICVNRKKKPENRREWDEGERAIPGTNTIIPWPEKADPDYEDFESDTLRMSVEEQTFRPFLIRPPMPLSIIDELRNKYSRFRTRHDYDYIVKKQMEDGKTQDRKDLIRTMRTPLQELAELRAKQKQAQEKELSDEQLAKIGEVIAQEQSRAEGAVKAMEQ